MIDSPLLKNLGGYVGGKWVAGGAGPAVPVYNPANGELLAELPDMGASGTTAGIEAAESALRNETSIDVRRAWLNAIAGAIRSHQGELARIITLEQGKPLKEAAAEVDYSAGFFEFCAGQLFRLAPHHLPEPVRSVQWTVRHRPTGVVGLITPWNFPLAMMAKKLGPALAAGCGIVAKPAELTPLTAVALWHLLERAEIPPGVANLVVGRPAQIGEVLCAHPAVRLISFTGSTAVGKLLLRDTAPHVKRLTLELGGNAPFMVFEDADVEAAADALMANKFRCAGQTCVCANRVLVQRPIADRFVDAVVKRVSQLRMGDGLANGTDIGPLINRAAVEKVRSHVGDAMARGCRRLVGADPEIGVAGSFFPPTVLVGATPDMRLSQEETFGPVVAISTFDTEDAAVQMANSTPYGLAAYLFTKRADRADRVAGRLVFGHIGVNTATGPIPEAPFGGLKQSGVGREGGVEGLLEYCEPQTTAHQ